MRVWFNKTFSSLHAALKLMRAGDVGKRYEIVYSAPEPHPLIMSVVDAVFSEPHSLDTDAYVLWCLKTAKNAHIDVFIPGRRQLEIVKNEALFREAGIKVLCSASPESLLTIEDKAAFYEATERCSARPPGWFACSTADEVRQAIDTLEDIGVRTCVKPSIGVFGAGFRIIESKCDPLRYMMDVHAHRIGREELLYSLRQYDEFKPLLVMEYLSGIEYSVDCLFFEGQLTTYVARRKEAGPGDPQRLVQEDDVHCACAELGAQFGLNGWANVQFKREPSSRLRLLEINPRMSGGIGKTAFSGLNLPYQGLVLATGGALHMPHGQTFRSTVVVERNVAEELVA